MGDDQKEYYLTQASYEEFQRQDVFPTLDDFVEAMPRATRSIHLVPSESVDITGMDKDSLIVVVASDAGYFGQLSQVHVNPTDAPSPPGDESIYKVDGPNDLGKEQTTPDSVTLDLHPSLNGPKGGDTPEWQKRTKPGDSDEYDRSHPNPYNKKGSNTFLVLIPWEVLTASGKRGENSPLQNGRVAMTWGEITSGLSTDVEKGATSCHVALKKADTTNNRWTFVVSSGSGNNYVVHLKALPRKNVKDLGKADLKIGCSCDFWKWQGPDHWASQNGYLDRTPRSNGAAPAVRDPQGKNRVCKHVYAASKFFLKYRVPEPKRASTLNESHGTTFTLNHEVSVPTRTLLTASEAQKLPLGQEKGSTTIASKTSWKLRRLSKNLLKYT